MKYNLWLTIEPVIVSQEGEELSWPDHEEYDGLGKIAGPMDSEEVLRLANSILYERGSNYEVSIPYVDHEGCSCPLCEEEEDDDQRIPSDVGSPSPDNPLWLPDYRSCPDLRQEEGDKAKKGDEATNHPPLETLS